MRRCRTSCFEIVEGYCEQFASAMAMMARVVGIPSRVSVGFLPGEQDEARLEGLDPRHACLAGAVLRQLRLGAVRAHAGQRDRIRAIVDRTERGLLRKRPVGKSVLGVDGRRGLTRHRAIGRCQASNRTFPGRAPARGWGRTLIGAGIALVLLAILAAPATIRVRRRSGRLNGERAG